jgi:PAS domain S-box-containing protein
MSDLTIRSQDLGTGALFQRIGEAVIVADASTGRIVLWNGAATEIFGYSSQEALGLSVEDLIPEHLKAQLRARMVRFHETGRGTHTNSHQLQDLPAVHKEGREIRIEMSLSPIGSVHDSNDERFVLAIVRDITERERTHERLIESERRFVNVLSNARAYVYRCLNQPGWPNEFASDYALELTGYSPEDLRVGGTVSFGNLIVEEDRQRVWEEVQLALRRRERFNVRYAIRHRNGEIRHVED